MTHRERIRCADVSRVEAQCLVVSGVLVPWLVTRGARCAGACAARRARGRAAADCFSARPRRRCSSIHSYAWMNVVQHVAEKIQLKLSSSWWRWREILNRPCLLTSAVALYWFIHLAALSCYATRLNSTYTLETLIALIWCIKRTR